MIVQYLTVRPYIAICHCSLSTTLHCSLCTIRQLKVLAPLALIANVVYLAAVAIILEYLVSHLNPVADLPYVGNLTDLPLFFGTVIFAFEGVAVVRRKISKK